MTGWWFRIQDEGLEGRPGIDWRAAKRLRRMTGGDMVVAPGQERIRAMCALYGAEYFAPATPTPRTTKP